jgi:hypothetical protein
MILSLRNHAKKRGGHVFGILTKEQTAREDEKELMTL